MSHLGDRVSALVDGRLGVDATERALVHLAGCETCRREVAAERSVRRLLAADAEPSAPPDLTASLLAMGGLGPLPPRRDERGSGFAGLTGAVPDEPPTGLPVPPGPLPARQAWPPPGPTTARDAAGPAARAGAGLGPAGLGRAGLGPAGLGAAGLGPACDPWPAHGSATAGPRRGLTVAGGSAAVLATGVLGVGLLGAQVPSQPAPSTLRAGSPAVGLAPAAEVRSVPAGQVLRRDTGAGVVADGWWDHVVRGTRVLAVLVTGS